MSVKVIYTRRYLTSQREGLEEYVVVEMSTYRRARNLAGRVNQGAADGYIYMAADAHEGPPFIEYGAEIVQ